MGFPSRIRILQPGYFANPEPIEAVCYRMIAMQGGAMTGYVVDSVEATVQLKQLHLQCLSSLLVRQPVRNVSARKHHLVPLLFVKMILLRGGALLESLGSHLVKKYVCQILK